MKDRIALILTITVSTVLIIAMAEPMITGRESSLEVARLIADVEKFTLGIIAGHLGNKALSEK